MSPEQYTQILLDTNNYYNSFTYISDGIQFDSKDYWCTPHEFEQYHGGDCEDFAIAKYFKLKTYGIETYLVYCLCNKIPHMICLDYTYLLILDNYNPSILTYEQRPDIELVYGFNETYWFPLLSTMKFSKTNDSLFHVLRSCLTFHSSEILTLWMDLLHRIESETITGDI